MTHILILIALVMTTPISAKADQANKDDKDVIRLSFSQNDIKAAYRYDSRGLAEQLVGVYCQERFGKTGILKEGACTKMLPLEANRCVARGMCN
jgi:hypothetical protein